MGLFCHAKVNTYTSRLLLLIRGHELFNAFLASDAMHDFVLCMTPNAVSCAVGARECQASQGEKGGVTLFHP
jgi:hypothetical protein